MIYRIKKCAELSPIEIKIILDHWEVDEWQNLSVEEFSKEFEKSEFHLLFDKDSTILSVARINFDFRINISGEVYSFPELVGLVSIIKNRGYGKVLLDMICHSLRERNIEAIGFCEKELRSFYEKCGIRILYDKAKYLREKANDRWVVPTDDDILNLTLSDGNINLLQGLSDENLGYIE